MGKPLVIDGFCGLGGWAEGFLAEGYDVVGFDTVRHDYGNGTYPGQLVLQDWLTLDGRQFRNAACIVASPPCTEYSYMAMPWSRAKQIAGALRGEVDFPEGYDGSRTLAELTALFDACFRIQREASEVGGRCIPLVVENVKGAQPWVGTAQAHYGSFYLWGDVGSVGGAIAGHRPKFGESIRARRAIKNGGGSWFGIGSPGQVETGQNPVNGSGVKLAALDWNGYGSPGYKPQGFNVTAAQKFKSDNGWSDSRKAATAQIAKIPEPLARHIARIYRP